MIHALNITSSDDEVQLTHSFIMNATKQMESESSILCSDLESCSKQAISVHALHLPLEDPSPHHMLYLQASGSLWESCKARAGLKGEQIRPQL